MAERRPWPALEIRSAGAADGAHDAQADLVAGVLDDFSPIAIEDLSILPVPAGGLWDPADPPEPGSPSAPLAWRVFFESSERRDAARHGLRAACADLDIRACDVPDEDWAARSQRAITAVTAGSFVVAPPWDVPDSPPAGVTVLVIEPSRGFGTGHHASTRLCLRALSETDVAGRRVLDLGTGSGVLALAAKSRGARAVTALDVDPDAIESAQASAALNRALGGIEWVVGDFRDESWPGRQIEPWDLVLANLTGGLLIASAPRVRRFIRSGGLLIASGFDERERAGVLAAFALSEVACYAEDGWVGLVLRRPPSPSHES